MDWRVIEEPENYVGHGEKGLSHLNFFASLFFLARRRWALVCGRAPGADRSTRWWVAGSWMGLAKARYDWQVDGDARFIIDELC